MNPFSNNFGRSPHWKADVPTPVGDLLLAKRVIPIDGEIDDYLANVVIAKLIYSDMGDKHEPVDLWIRSNGGPVTAALAILDTMDFVDCPVRTFTSTAYGTAAVIATHGAEGMRFASGRGATFGFVPITGRSLYASSFFERITDRLIDTIAADTDKSVQQVREWSDGSVWFDPSEALANGLIDGVLDEELSFDD